MLADTGLQHLAEHVHSPVQLVLLHQPVSESNEVCLFHSTKVQKRLVQKEVWLLAWRHFFPSSNRLCIAVSLSARAALELDGPARAILHQAELQPWKTAFGPAAAQLSSAKQLPAIQKPTNIL